MSSRHNRMKTIFRIVILSFLAVSVPGSLSSYGGIGGRSGWALLPLPGHYQRYQPPRSILGRDLKTWQVVKNQLPIKPRLKGASPASTIEAMMQSADAVVLGQVRQITPQWEKAELNVPLIYSYVRVEVEESLKGEVPRGGFVTVRNVGGQVGDRRLEVSHVPSFNQMGERVLLFLKGSSSEIYRIPFGTEGKLLVREGDTLEFQDRVLPLGVVRRVARQME